MNGAGKTVRLLGVDRSGLEYACVQGWGFSDGPVDAASIAAMKTWSINAVRVPLNESCWLGINGVKAQYSGTAYRTFVQGYVARPSTAGLVAILDLHWSVNGQEQMPDAAHAHDAIWKCWRDGCGKWAGMQRLVSAVRSAGGRWRLVSRLDVGHVELQQRPRTDQPL